MPPDLAHWREASAASPLVVGDADLPAAVIAHGAGSTADFIARSFAAALAACGFRLVTWNQWDAGAERSLADLADLANRFDAALLGGFSLGAHLAARLAARDPGAAAAGLWLVMPAWTGLPDGVAHLSHEAAAAVAADGVDGALRRVEHGAPAWVHGELATAWAEYGAERLARSLRDTAASLAPTTEELASLDRAVGVVALAGDPFHPEPVAEAWAGTLPRARLRVVQPVEPAADRAVLGRAAAAAWRAAGGVSGSR